MPIHPIDYNRLTIWSQTDLAYIQQEPLLRPFFRYTPALSSFPEVIGNRRTFDTNRALLQDVISKQYQGLGFQSPFVADELLDDNTFTITTAHQPSLLTGPLYYIYKIAGTINLARTVEQQNPGTHIIPLFVVGGEDHDWEEINHLHLFGKKITWERTASGPCGRLSNTGLDAFIEQILTFFERDLHYEEVKELLRSSLEGTTTYGQFHQKLIIRLFGQSGLVVLNMDDPALKRAFVPLMKKEIADQFSHQYVPAIQEQLESIGYKPQAYCRPINLFYISEGLRERIEIEGDEFVRIDSQVRYTRSELLEQLEQHPENFSPNVVMRPLYQELILPNLAYVGGGGEIAYWLERKTQFEAAGLHFPMLVRRNSVLQIDDSTISQIEKLELTWEDFLADTDTIIRQYIKSHSEADLTFEQEVREITLAYQQLANKAEKIDPTLAKAILADQTKQVKHFEQLTSRLIRTEKQHHETQTKRIQKVKEKLFPEGGLQERHDNFLPYYAQHGPSWITKMIEACDPMHSRFLVMTYPLS